jgi:DNA-binding response OmpR family regulator
VLVVAGDEDLLARWSFVLETKLYRVHRAATAAEALAWLAGLETDAVYVLIVAMPLDGLDALLADARGLHPEMRTLVAASCRADRYIGAADVFMPEVSMIDLVERVRCLAARKRGPKTGPKAERKHEAKPVSAAAVARRQLAKSAHPDMHGGSHEQMARLNKARTEALGFELRYITTADGAGPG